MSPFKEGSRETGKMFSNKSLELGFPVGTSGKEPACQCRTHERHGFDPWVGKIPWRRKGQPTPVFLPGKSHIDRGALWATVLGLQRVGHNLAIKTVAAATAGSLVSLASLSESGPIEVD